MTTCIITDNTAQLPYGSFPGQRLIKSMTLRVENRCLIPPTVEDYLRIYQQLEHEFSAMLVLTLSSHLLPAAEAAHQAAVQHGGMAHIAVLDSQQTGAGLGILAQIGAQAAAAGSSLSEVEEQIRAAIPHVYTLLHVEAEGLSRHTQLYPLQENPHDAFGLFPLFTLEDGQLAVYKKIRTRRHLLESFQEFIEEFEYPQQITFLRGPGNILRSRPLREVTRDLFPETPFGEVEMSAPLAAMFGPQAVGITVMEMPKHKSVSQ